MRDCERVGADVDLERARELLDQLRHALDGQAWREAVHVLERKAKEVSGPP